MIPMTLGEIADAVGGVLNYKAFARRLAADVFTDSRTPVKNGLFIPLRGEHFDGHAYINDAFGGGALCALVDKYTQTEKPIIRVGDTRRALLDLAGHYRRKFDIPVVAVTGSAGKTTTKDLIAAVLAERFAVLKTDENLNNEIGVPKMLFRLDDSYEIAVLEMGMSGFGEIQNLSRAAQPDVGVIVNIGTAHIEKLGNREGILRAKAELLDFMHEDAHIVLNGADDMLVGLRGTRRNIQYYGADVFASHMEENELEGVSFDCHACGEVYRVHVPLPGTHMVQNALAAASVGHIFGMKPSEISSGISKFIPSAMRMERFKTISGAEVISDVYNANPEAMMRALDVLSKAKGRRTAILGDMLELGEHAAGLHAEVGKHAASLGIDTIICIGRESRRMAEGAMVAGGDTRYYETKPDFLPHLPKLLADGGTVLVKASRGMGFEEITEGLRNA